MTDLEELCVYPPGVGEMLLNMVEDIDCAHCPAYDMCANDELEAARACRETMEAWLEMDAEPGSVVAVEPEVRTVEIGGQLFRMLQTHPYKPEGGGGGIMYPLGNGGRGTVRLYANDEVFVEAEQK